MTSVSCASSVTSQKSSANCEPGNRSKSCDTLCTSNSSCFFKKRKPMNPLAYSLRPTHQKPNPVKQRVMSAKLLKLRQLQSQLNDANYHLAEVARENQVLKTLQKRQDKALSRYESTNADLPRLLHSHEEEIRTLTERNKGLKRTVKDLTEQLKQKEDELGRARDQLSRLEKLNKDKHLTEREKLVDQLEDLKMKLQKSEEQTTMLNRKLILESKISKQRLNAEIVKHKQSRKELHHALEEIDRLTALLDVKDNTVRPRRLGSMSMVHLGTIDREKVQSAKNFPQTPVMDVKLEPIRNIKEEMARKSNQTDMLKVPIDNIKMRLTNGVENTSSNSSSSASRDHSADSHNSRPNSSLKLEKLPKVKESRKDVEKHSSDNAAQQLDDKIKRVMEKCSEDADKKLTEYCSEMVNSVKSCSKVIQLHKENLKSSQYDTDALLEAFKTTEQIESKLKKSFFNSDDSDMSFVCDILNDEYKFKDTNVRKNKEPLVDVESKKKLLATLRAIDNGDSFDSLEDGKTNQTRNVMKEIFGNVSN